MSMANLDICFGRNRGAGDNVVYVDDVAFSVLDEYREVAVPVWSFIKPEIARSAVPLVRVRKEPHDRLS